MFAPAYFAPSYFGPQYFAPNTGDVPSSVDKPKFGGNRSRAELVDADDRMVMKLAALAILEIF